MDHRLIPVLRRDWGFFDRQRSLFSDFFKDFDNEFSQFEEELERMRRGMFQLDHHDSGSTASTGDNDSSESGKTAASNSNHLQVEKPFVTDIDGNKKMALRFDVSQFNPDEITVKTVDNTLNVHAKHIEEGPGKKIYREFSKSYTLPPHVDPHHVTSTLTQDGVLHIEAPTTAAIEAPKENLIPITKM